MIARPSWYQLKSPQRRITDRFINKPRPCVGWGNRFQINQTSNGVKVVWEYKDFFFWFFLYGCERVIGTNEKWGRIHTESFTFTRGRYRKVWSLQMRGNEKKRAGGGGCGEKQAARRLNADFNAGPRSTPIVNFPPCLLELSLTRRWTDASDRTLRHRKLQQTATNLIIISSFHTSALISGTLQSAGRYPANSLLYTLLTNRIICK